VFGGLLKEQSGTGLRNVSGDMIKQIHKGKHTTNLIVVATFVNFSGRKTLTRCTTN
jgi:hypothetical protein